MGDFTAWQWLVLAQHELLLFAAIFFLIGAADELAVDFFWIWLKLTGRAKTRTLSEHDAGCTRLNGVAAIFIPAWQEANVIGATIGHALSAWPHRDMRIYAGCYRNDPQTMGAIIAAAAADARVRLVVHNRDGPSTKADCLNRLYHALEHDEARLGMRAHMVVLHDAEDMVDPAGLGLLDKAIVSADLAQLPVVPIPQEQSPWIAGHYGEEFAEAHGKAMVVRDALGAAMPLAGVGCAIRREMLAQLADASGRGEPFAADCLTEDYELGLGVAERGGTARFVRWRHADGTLVATRACFPADLVASVRQKTRWVHGIAFQAWDRLGWSGRPAEIWMRMRDRRGPLNALVLAVAYALLVLSAVIWAFNALGVGEPLILSPVLKLMLMLNFASFVWRAAWRFGFTFREYGVTEALRAVLRIPVANVIAIMAGRRAFQSYLRTLTGARTVWDKTDHAAHPALMRETAGAA